MTLLVSMAACGTNTGSQAPQSSAPSANPVSVAPSTASEAPTGIGPAELADLTLAIPFPNNQFKHEVWIADEKGWLDEAGIDSVEIVTADDVRAAIVSGSADIGIESAGAAMMAIEEGLPIEIIASNECRQQFAFAVQPDVNDVNDLAGADIVLAGTTGDPAEFERREVLAEEGWDVDAVGAHVVYPGPGSEAWIEFFKAGRVKLIPYYGDDEIELREAGAKFPVNALRNWPNDVYIVKKGWVEEHPNTAAQFLLFQLKATEFIIAPGVGQQPTNKAEIVRIYQENGVQDVERDYANNPSWNVFGTEGVCANLYYGEEAWNTTIETQSLDITVPFEDGVDLSALLRAQELMGLDNSPPSDIPWPPDE